MKFFKEIHQPVNEISRGDYYKKATMQRGQAGMSAAFAASPEERAKQTAIFQKRERGLNRLKARQEKERKAEQDKQLADLVARLPELKAEYESMKEKYKSLGGSNWQYADREQNLTASEREARAMEGQMNTLWRQIQAAEKAQGQQGVAEGAEFGAYYSEQVAQEIFNKRQDISSEDEVLNQAYHIVSNDKGQRSARYMFNYDPDFSSDVVSNYFYLQKQGVAEGYGDEDNPVASAITRRILLQRHDLLQKYGPAKVTQAIDDVVDYYDLGPDEEIGSSDVSNWVKQVERSLASMGEGVEEASLAQMRDYFNQPDDSIAVDNKFGSPEYKRPARVPPEIQALVNKMYHAGKISPAEFDILRKFQQETKINVGIKEADMSTGNQGYDSMLAVMKAVDAGHDATFNLGGEPIILDYNEARFLAGRYKAFLKAGRQEEFLKYMESPIAFDRLMKQLRDLMDKQKNFRGSVQGERGVEEAYPGHIQKGRELDAATKGIQANLDKRIKQVDSLVVDALKIMKGPELSHAVDALKTVLGDREYNSRRGFYNFYIKQIVNMYNKQGVEEAAPGFVKAAAGLAVGTLAAAGAPAIVGILGPLLGIPMAAYGAYNASKLGMAGVEKLWDMATEKLGSSEKVEQYANAQIAKLPPEKAQAASAVVKQVTESRKILPEVNENEYWCQLDSMAKPIPEGYKRTASGYITRK